MTPGDDLINGTAGDDSLEGLAGDDTINGLGGNDTLDGGDDVDTLNGGAGDDRLILGDAATAFGDGVNVAGVDGGTGVDTLVIPFNRNQITQSFGDVDPLTTFTLGDPFNNDIRPIGIERLEFDDQTVELVLGSSGNDVLTASLGISAILVSGLGDDTLTGSNAADSIQANTTAVGDGNKTINGLGGNDALSAGDGNDSILGGDGNDTLIGDDGADTLNGMADADFIFGNEGADFLFGGDGADALFGENGSDNLNGGAGADILNGGGGLDRVSYSNSAAAVIVNLLANSASGGDAAGDTFTSIEDLQGSGFSDRLTGDAAANGLFGGSG
ncbi:MAG: calcium-binding protein, partial [Pseudomonadota bacterium]